MTYEMSKKDQARNWKLTREALREAGTLAPGGPDTAGYAPPGMTGDFTPNCGAPKNADAVNKGLTWSAKYGKYLHPIELGAEVWTANEGWQRFFDDPGDAQPTLKVVQLTYDPWAFLDAGDYFSKPSYERS